MSTDTESSVACLGWQCLMTKPENPEQAGWREGYCQECQDELARDEIRAERQDARNEVERPTPITDAFLERINGILMIDHYAETAKHAKDLERQLAEAIEARKASARESLDMVQNASKREQRAKRERDDARRQVDTLAEALRDIKDRCSDATIMLHPDADAKGCVDDCLEWSEQALAALDRKEQE